MIRRLEQGLWPWNPPVGYYLPKLPNVRLSVSKIDPNCGDEIKDIFSMYATGNYTFQAISQRITARHIKNISGRVLYISKQQVEKTIANPFYIGLLKSSIDGKTYQGKHQRLVDPEVWDKCQAVRNGKGQRSVRKKVNRNFPLRGLVVGECGHPFTGALSRGKGGKRYGYYFCLQRDAGNYKISTLHGKFLALLDQIQPPQETINLYFEIFLEELGQITNQTETQQKKVAFELAGLTKEQANLVKMRAREEISAELFRQQNQEYENEINKLKGLSVQPQIQKVDWDEVCAYGKEFVTDIRGKWQSLEEVEDKINYQSSIFPKKLHWDGNDYRTPELLEVLHDMQCLKNNDVTPERITPMSTSQAHFVRLKCANFAIVQV